MKVRNRAAALVVSLAVVFGSVGLASGAAQAAPMAPSVRAGQFCAKADLGKVVKADNGKMVKCTHVDGYNRWVVK